MAFLLENKMRFTKVVDKNIDKEDLEKVIDAQANDNLKLVDIVDVKDIKVLYFEEFSFNE